MSQVQQQKRRTAASAFTLTTALTAGKCAVAAASGSLAVAGVALDGLADVASAAATWWVVRAAAHPADDEHPFGHGKFESVAALGQGVLVGGLGAMLAVEAVRQLAMHDMSMRMPQAPLALGTLVVTLGTDAWRAVRLQHAARITGSAALGAAGTNVALDAAGAAIGLAGVGIAGAGVPVADPIAAVIVALLLCVGGAKLLQGATAVLVDRAPPGLAALLAARAAAVPGVGRVVGVRVRGQSPIFAEMTIEVDEALAMRDAEQIRAAVQGALSAVHAEAELEVLVVLQARAAAPAAPDASDRGAPTAGARSPGS